MYKTLPKFAVAISIQIGNFIILSYLIFIIIATIMTYLKTKEKIKLLFLLGFFFFIIGFWIHLSTTLNIIESNFWTRYGIGIGWILDLIILMVVFSNQIRQSFLKNIHLKQELNRTKLSAANALLEGQLEERQRLSSELHDGISIQMALLKMRLDKLFIKKTTAEQDILKSLTDISQDVRAFTHAIAPLDLDNETLEDAIENLIYKIENQTNLSVDLHLNNLEEEKLQKNQKYALYQTLQELFNNTIKHSEASEVLINLQNSQNFINLSYHDDGNGFDINSIKNGIGLSNIQARADLFNGDFNIHSDKNGSQFEFSFVVSN
jgi:signal transduction histidine kinase